MKKTLRYFLRTVAALLALLVLIWLIVAVYVLVKKSSILDKARIALKTRVGPESTLGDIDISFFRHFPHITLQVSKISLRDSLWQRHHHDLLAVDQALISLDEWHSLLAGRLQLGRIYLQHGSIYLYTDSTGYSNTSIFHSTPSSSHKGGDEARLPGITLSDIRFVLEKQDKRKLFDLDIKQMDCAIEKDDRLLYFDIRMTTGVKSFSFNTEKGSFVKDKTLSGRIHLQYHPGSKILQFEKVVLQINGHPFRFSGRFFPDVHPDPFNITIETENIHFADATALLTPDLHQKLDGYAIDRPISIIAVLDAGSADNPKELINVKINTSANSINTPAGRFDNVSFKGSFSNEYIRGLPRNDSNSIIRFTGFTGTLDSIPLQSDSINIINLKHPVLLCDVHANFEIPRLNAFAGSKDVRFEGGRCKLNVRYKGPLSLNDSTANSLRGTLDVDSGVVTYVPYKLSLTGSKGRIRFDNQDMYIDKLETHAGNTRFLVTGVARKVVSLLDQQPDHVNMDLRLTTQNLDLEDLRTLAGRPVEAPVQATGKSAKGLLVPNGSRLDKMIREGNIRLMVEAADLRYKKFKGAHAKADLLFSGSEIRLQHLQLEQGVGSMSASGNLLRQSGDGNPLSFTCHMESVDLPGLFAEFNNFGQTALRDKNLKGRLTADIKMAGRMTDKGALEQGSLKGSVDFSIKGGQLIDFEPMEKIHQTVMKKRDLSEIHFAELGSQLDLDTTTFKVHRMEIQSTAFSLYVEGVYDVKAGPDMSLLIPLSNLKKDRNPDIPPTNKGNDSKAGPSLRLRARNGDDGKLKITWDPFKRALKSPRPKARH